jgi:hypothetical protein
MWRIVSLKDDFYSFRHTGRALTEAADSRLIEKELSGAAVRLPQPIQNGLRELRQILRYNFASSDFVEDCDGQMWFLDLNPSGQWAWLEERYGVPLSRRFVQLAR